MRGQRTFEVLPAANTSAAQEMSRRHQVHAGLVEAIARGDADQTRRLRASRGCRLWCQSRLMAVS